MKTDKNCPICEKRVELTMEICANCGFENISIPINASNQLRAYVNHKVLSYKKLFDDNKRLLQSNNDIQENLRSSKSEVNDLKNKIKTLDEVIKNAEEKIKKLIISNNEVESLRRQIEELKKDLASLKSYKQKYENLVHSIKI